MGVDRNRLTGLFRSLGANLRRRTVLCLIGSTPTIYLGQDARQTDDIDVWHPASDYDAGELAAACEQAGIVFDPADSLPPNAVYLQIVRPGIVALPRRFEQEVVASFGALTVTMPSAAVIIAGSRSRLTRCGRSFVPFHEGRIGRSRWTISSC